MSSEVKKVNEEVSVPEYTVHVTKSVRIGNDEINSEIAKTSDMSPENYRTISMVSSRVDRIFDYLEDRKEKDWIDPPYDPDEWALISEYDTRINRSNNIKARNIALNGWAIEPVFENMTKAEQVIADQQKKELFNLFEHFNSKESINSIMNKVVIDREAIGLGGLVIKRNALNRIVGGFHKRGVELRVRKPGTIDPPLGFVSVEDDSLSDNDVEMDEWLRVRENNVVKTYYKEFGDRRIISKGTGKVRANIAIKNRASEILPFKVYAPGVKHYGVPRAGSSKFAVMGNYWVNVQNVSLLKNDATPKMAILVQNGQLETESLNRIEDFFNIFNKGPESEGRVLIIQPSKKHTGLPGPNVPQTEIKIVPLSLGVIDDASFERYKIENNREKAECYGIPEVLYGKVENVGKAAANLIDKVFSMQEIQPDINEINDVMNRTIVRDYLGKSILVPINFDDSVKGIVNGGECFDSDITLKSIIGEDEYEKFLRKNVYSKVSIIKKKLSSFPERWRLTDIVVKENNENGSVPIVEGLKFDSTVFVRFALKIPKVTDELEKARVFRLFHELASLTPNDVAIEQGKEQKEEPWAKRPVRITELMLESGVSAEEALGVKASSSNVLTDQNVIGSSDGVKALKTELVKALIAIRELREELAFDRAYES